jgi:Zn-dependent peptidase ImmA (M78 family)
MNNIERVLELREDWDIQLRNKSSKIGVNRIIKGCCYGDKELIEIYTNTLKDNDDYNITLIHEIYHALYPNLSEENVEFCARHTYKINPKFAEDIKSVFNLPLKIK